MSDEDFIADYKRLLQGPARRRQGRHHATDATEMSELEAELAPDPRTSPHLMYWTAEGPLANSLVVVRKGCSRKYLGHYASTPVTEDTADNTLPDFAIGVAIEGYYEVQEPEVERNLRWVPMPTNPRVVARATGKRSDRPPLA
jgi:hypothetical protein